MEGGLGLERAHMVCFPCLSFLPPLYTNLSHSLLQQEAGMLINRACLLSYRYCTPNTGLRNVSLPYPSLVSSLQRPSALVAGAGLLICLLMVADDSHGASQVVLAAMQYCTSFSFPIGQ